MQRVGAVRKRLQEGAVAHGELSGGFVARTQRSLVACGGGGQIGLDGEQMRVFCRNREKETSEKRFERSQWLKVHNTN